LAKPNYAFAKRQKELAKKQKKEEKLKRKGERDPSDTSEDQPDDTGLASGTGPAQPSDLSGPDQPGERPEPA
jgi:hypothetical protein